MSKRKFPEIFLFDVYIAILKIEKVTARFRSSESLLHDFVCWDSVIREFEILGEATRHLINSGLIEKDYKVVVDFRNLLIHNYFGIDAEEVWNVVKNDLPEFKEVIIDAINRIEPALKMQLVDSYMEMNEHLDFILNELEKFKV